MINEFRPDDNFMDEYILDDDGIKIIITRFDNGSTLSKMIIPKEIFIEAYNRWIRGDKIESEKNESEKIRRITNPFRG